jgi:hypothetical protein
MLHVVLQINALLPLLIGDDGAPHGYVQEIGQPAL